MPTAPARQASIAKRRKTCEAPAPLQFRLCKRKGVRGGFGAAQRFSAQTVRPGIGARV